MPQLPDMSFPGGSSQLSQQDLQDYSAQLNRNLRWLLSHLDETNVIKAQSATIAEVYAGNIQANKIITTDGKITNAQIDNLKASQIDVADGKITNAQINNLKASQIDVTDGKITNAQIDNLKASQIDVADGKITNAQIDSLAADKITAGYISTGGWTGSGTDYLTMYRQYLSFKDVNDATKMFMGFAPDKDNVQTPLIVMGAGDGYGSNRGYIAKDASSLNMFYIGDKTAGEVSYLKLSKDQIECSHELKLNVKLADSYITNATTWNAKINETDMKTIIKDPLKLLDIPKENITSVYADRLTAGYISTGGWTGSGTDYISMYRELLQFKDVNNLTKMALGFAPNKDNVQVPMIVMGAGDGYGNNRGYIQKDTDGLSMYYIDSSSNVSYLKLSGTKASLNGYDVFSKADSISDSYLASATSWNNKLQKLNTSGNYSSGDISSSTIIGNTIRTAASSNNRVELTSSGLTQYNSSNQNNGIYVNPTYSDLILYWNNSQLFKIYNEVNGNISIYAGTTRFMSTSGTTTTIYETWNFTNATVTGLTAKFS